MFTIKEIAKLNKTLALDLFLEKNGIDSSLYSVGFRENNKICLFADSGVWFSAFIKKNKERNLKKYLNFGDACLDFIIILLEASGKTKEQQKKILSDIRAYLIEEQQKKFYQI